MTGCSSESSRGNGPCPSAWFVPYPKAKLNTCFTSIMNFLLECLVCPQNSPVSVILYLSYLAIALWQFLVVCNYFIYGNRPSSVSI